MLFKPNFYFENINDIEPEFLKKISVDTLILDVDNTLSLQKGSVIIDKVPEWLQYMLQNNIKLIILSNAVPKRMTGFSKRIGIPFVGLGLKPLPFGYFRAAKRTNSKIKNCAIVGDQLFTDIMGGHLAFCKTILVAPKEMEPSRGFKIKRYFERKLLKHYHIKCNY